MNSYDRLCYFYYGIIPDRPDSFVFDNVCSRLGIQDKDNKFTLWECLWPGFVNPYNFDDNFNYKPAPKLPLCSYEFLEMKGVIKYVV